jgi:hypothetical protein
MEKQMGRIEQEGADVVFRQDDGEITAYLTDYEERQELTHEGRRDVKILFCSLLAFAIVYLAVIFLLGL